MKQFGHIAEAPQARSIVAAATEAVGKGSWFGFCFWVRRAFRLGFSGSPRNRAFRPWGMPSDAAQIHTPGAKAPFVARPERAKPEGLAYLEAKTLGHTLKALAFVLILVAGSSLFAQTPAPAPLPAQLATAKSIFLAKGTSNVNADVVPAYNTLYRLLESSKRYRMAAAPADADLSCEFSIIGIITASVSTKGSNGSTESDFLQIVIRDAKTQALLWTISEGVDRALLAKNKEKNLSDAVVRLAADIKYVTTPGATAVSTIQ
ncbi:MAG: hypothetical protein FWD64_13275 [Acidobacteriaceae bacterium]|nr:hypothetical protein [Acidobacteriaceae bacterium]